MLCCTCVDEKTYGVVQKFGKFSKIVSPGINILLWPCESVAGSVSTRLQQLAIKNEAKTKENVFVTLMIAIQFQVQEEHVQLAFYSMENPQKQMISFVEDALRAIVPTLELEHLFLEKEKISLEIKELLSKKMKSYGYTITDTLILDIDPEASVKAAMNKISEARRLREAAEFSAETQKLVMVKQAEAEAETKRLQGVGVALQRKAILGGLQEGVEGLSSALGVSADETMKYTMLTQYFDMLKDIGTSPNKATIFIPHVPGSVSAMADQMSMAMMESRVATLHMEKK